MYRVAVGGATGNVGGEMIRVLEQRHFPVGKFIPLASSASTGKRVQFNGESYAVRDMATVDFSEIDLLLLSTGSANSKTISPQAAAAGCVVIDNSSAFRMDPDAPLIVPEVNPEKLDEWARNRILPVANCSTIQLVIALKPLHDAAHIKRIVVSTYQSASGGGRAMLERLTGPWDPAGIDVRSLVKHAKASLEAGEDKPITFNVVPHIDTFMEDGRTREEWKMEVETQKIFGSPIPVAATCARVSTFVCHTEAISIELEKPLTAAEARQLLAHAPGVRVVDEPVAGGYATPLDVMGTDDVFVSRIRRDHTVENGLQIWVVADNIRKGAALNAVQIAECLVDRQDFAQYREARLAR
ncbi:aspartate-semialdehyde dehydrogenase [Paraburkholderia dipogonis]|uniref:aspartate-semialdehyde dehydrogenase n=1 Tax=Paraburkholderia dipogonis TaxID=1211383 RepID=UPI0038BA0801